VLYNLIEMSKLFLIRNITFRFINYSASIKASKSLRLFLNHPFHLYDILAFKFFKLNIFRNNCSKSLSGASGSSSSGNTIRQPKKDRKNIKNIIQKNIIKKEWNKMKYSFPKDKLVILHLLKHKL